MSYFFINTDTGETFKCEDDVWIKALETAKQNYWDPCGTIYDIEYDIEDECAFIEDENQILYTIVFAFKENDEWNGSYTEKRNQVLDFNDTVFLAEALEGTDTDPDLVDFIDKGSFRICAD